MTEKLDGEEKGKAVFPPPGDLVNRSGLVGSDRHIHAIDAIKECLKALDRDIARQQFSDSIFGAIKILFFLGDPWDRDLVKKTIKAFVLEEYTPTLLSPDRIEENGLPYLRYIEEFLRDAEQAAKDAPPALHPSVEYKNAILELMKEIFREILSEHEDVRIS